MPFEVTGSRRTHEGVLAAVRVDAVRLPDGEVVEREVVAHPSAVAVVPVEADGTVVLLRQYRHPVGEEVLEIPAGILDVDGEAPADAARRELLEEAGLVAGDLEPLVTFHNSAGWTDEQTTVYLARDVRAGAAPADFTPHGEEAHMAVVRMPLDALLAAAVRGEVPDAKTLIGVLLAARRLAGPDAPPGSA